MLIFTAVLVWCSLGGVGAEKNREVISVCLFISDKVQPSALLPSWLRARLSDFVPPHLHVRRKKPRKPCAARLPGGLWNLNSIKSEKWFKMQWGYDMNQQQIKGWTKHTKNLTWDLLRTPKKQQQWRASSLINPLDIWRTFATEDQKKCQQMHGLVGKYERTSYNEKRPRTLC